jgi:HD-GYP domain-containing protein (c-di-GMP phosphodiesterase class II)
MVEFSKIVKKMRHDGDREARSSVPLPAPPAAPAAQERVSPVPDELAKEYEGGIEKETPRSLKPLFIREDAPDSQAVLTPVAFRSSEPAGSFSASSGPLPDASGGSKTRFLSKDDEARALYDALMDQARVVFAKDVDYGKIDISVLTRAIKNAVDAMMAGDEKLSELAVVLILQGEENYLLQHSVNSCLISLVIGRGHGYDGEKMGELGLASFLHDIGMVAYEDLARVRRALTQAEYAKVKNHVTTGDTLLRKFHPALSETILTTQFEIHERLDGTGYPTGSRMVTDFAKIIALADTFESMIHPRPFRPRYSIMEVYKRIFDAKSKFDQDMIKVLVERIGFFPNGSFIQLNTKEIGRVIAQNHKSPLRPMIRLLFDENEKRLYDEQVKDVNMVKYPTLHIVKCFLGDAREAKFI